MEPNGLKWGFVRVVHEMRMLLVPLPASSRVYFLLAVLTRMSYIPVYFSFLQHRFADLPTETAAGPMCYLKKIIITSFG